MFTLCVPSLRVPGSWALEYSISWLSMVGGRAQWCAFTVSGNKSCSSAFILLSKHTPPLSPSFLQFVLGDKFYTETNLDLFLSST